MTLWLLIVVQIAPSALFALMALLAGALRSGAVERALAATRANAQPPLTPQEAFTRYARGGTATRIALSVVAILTPLLGVMINLFLAFAAASFPNIPDLAPVFVILAVAFIPCALAPTAAYASATAWADAQAMRELRGLTTRPADLIALRLKSLLLLTAPVLFITEVAVALFSSFMSLEARIAVFAALILLIVGWAIAWSNRLRLLYPTTPLAQTAWAPVATRAEGWARLAGVSLGGVQMAQSGAFGFADGNITGVFSRTIYLSDRFLQATDWRQQDALIAYLLGLDTRRRRLYLFSYGSSALILIFYAVIVFFPDSLSAASIAFIPIFFLVIMALRIFRLSGSVYSLTRRYMLLSDADRLGAELTGDPMAAIAMLTTASALTTQDPTMATVAGATLPPRMTLLTLGVGQRVAALDALMRRAGPRAPWAYQPVPSAAPVMLGPFTLTTPLQPGQANAPAPTPVPAARYPVVAPPPPVYPPFALPMPYPAPVPVGAPSLAYPQPGADSSAYPQAPAYPAPYPQAYPQAPAYLPANPSTYPQAPAYPYPPAPTPPALPTLPTPPTLPAPPTSSAPPAPPR